MADLSHHALTKSGEAVFPGAIDDRAWEALKSSYQVGDFLMPCCPHVPAIPKTGPNGTRFFAHLNGGCETAPESVWHKTAKALLRFHLSEIGIPSFEEAKAEGWRADIYFELAGRRFALEVQQSYQHLRVYLQRQARYEAAGVQCVWVLYKPRWSTLLDSIGKKRFREEFGRRIPEGGYYPFLPSLPIVCMELDPPTIIMGGSIHPTSDVPRFLAAIIAGAFVYEGGRWVIA